MQAIPVLKEIHSFIAYIFLFSTTISLFFGISRYIRKTRFSNTQFVLAKMAFIASHTQLVLGLLLWWFHGFAQMLSENFKGVMSDSQVRLVAVEHPLTNIIAVTLLTIGYISIKKTALDQSKHLKSIIYFGIALLLVLSRIPYNSWFNN